MSNPRIISGKARGMRLRPVPGDITRPITDRVKESLFNIINVDIQGASWLDLFGGTGSVGIEALSRGAGYVRFIDLNRSAIQTIRDNLVSTHLELNAHVIQADAFAYLQTQPDREFDYIYVAPPQYKKMWFQALSGVDRNPNWLSPDAWVMVQIDPVELEPIDLEWLIQFDQRRYGSTTLIFYQKRLVFTD